MSTVTVNATAGVNFDQGQWYGTVTAIGRLYHTTCGFSDRLLAQQAAEAWIELSRKRTDFRDRITTK